MNIPSRAAARRSGFTLVELLVAAAVSVMIMAILATAFQSAIDTMRQMRSVSGLQDQLRAATEMIRRDLQGNHFVSRDMLSPTVNLQISGAKLSAQWLNDPIWQPPLGGFFHIESNASWATPEGSADGITSSRSSAPSLTAGFLLHFTSILAGDSPPNTYSATINSGAVFSSPAAEIGYFLDSTQPSGSTSNGPTGSALLYRLIRRQRLVALTTVEQGSNFAGLSAADQGLVATSGAGSPIVPYTLADLTNPANRLGGTAFDRTPPSTSPPAPDVKLSALTNSNVGDDVLLSNVISFTVQANWDGGTQQPRTFNNGNSDYPFDYIDLNDTNQPNTEYVFDTGYIAPPPTPPATTPPAGPAWGSVLPNGVAPLPQPQPTPPAAYPSGKLIRVKSLQIRLRVYDPQLKSARQVTIVQDM